MPKMIHDLISPDEEWTASPFVPPCE